MVLLLLFIVSVCSARANDQRTEEKAPSQETILAKVIETYEPLVTEAVDENPKINVSKVYAMIAAESGGDPKAVSQRGARGLLQVMPRTARSIGCSSDLSNPREGINCGVRYLAILTELGFEGDALIAAYCYGPGAVREKIRRGESISKLPYVKTVRRLINFIES